jgi:hypothetical protein
MIPAVRSTIPLIRIAPITESMALKGRTPA